LGKWGFIWGPDNGEKLEGNQIRGVKASYESKNIFNVKGKKEKEGRFAERFTKGRISRGQGGGSKGARRM